jgi:charged multivesicular body protein 4
MNEVDATMDNIREEMERANEISEAISNPLNVIPGQEIDEDELKNELAELEQEQLNEVLSGAERVPVHSPGRVAAPAAGMFLLLRLCDAKIRGLTAYSMCSIQVTGGSGR